MNTNSDIDFNQIITDLKKLVEEKRSISYTFVSIQYKVHVKDAIQILDQLLAEERKNGNNLCVNYLLSGNNDNIDNDNEIKMERFMIVNESDMDSTTDWFANGFNKHVYSVGFGEDNDSVDLNFNEFEFNVKSKDDLKDLQNLTYVQNPNIEFRDTRRRVAKTVVEIIDDKRDETKRTSNVKNDCKSKTKSKPNQKGRTVKNMFAKSKTVVKNEDNEEKQTSDVKENDDPFKSDSEEEEEIKEEVKQQNEDTNDVIKMSSDEEIVDKKDTKVKNNKKRNSKNALESSEEEEEIIVSRKRSKKYKRVRLISESDSDDQKETSIDKFVDNKCDSKPIKKIEVKQETHVDEDGYVVTKMVKKEVEINGNDSKANESEEKTDLKSKPKQNAKKNVDKKEDKKVEPKKSKVENKKDGKGMTQSSITSFFKPKPVVT